jgi:hypothetical protein
MTSSANPHYCLHAATEDPTVANTNAVSRPKAGDEALLWYRDTKPRFYRPYLIRVVQLDDTAMEFVFLDNNTGADLALSRPTHKIAYHDGRYAYSALPSTAPKVRPGSSKSCGLLFISDLYMQQLPRADQALIAASGNDDEKWPLSAGKFSAPPPRPRRRTRRRAA